MRSRADLTFAHDVATGEGQAAFAGLMREVFGVAPTPTSGESPRWVCTAFFDRDGRCVAGAEVARLRLSTDSGPIEAGGIRLVGVAEDWRGHGLFRDLMQHAIDWGRERRLELLLLYTADAGLYGRFGFEPVPQHAFVGPAPLPVAGAAAHLIDDVAQERALVDRLLATRAPVSSRIAVVDAPGLFLAKLAGDDSPSLAYLSDLDALIVSEDDDDETLILVDVVAATLPTMARIVGALSRRYRRIKTLFPPDLLEWAGKPVPEETGLMARGALPPIMRQPFALPPTTEF